MTWVIIVMVLGTAPVETGLEFPSAKECGERAYAINAMTGTSAAFSDAWDEASSPENSQFFPWGSRDAARKAVWQSYGAYNVATCVPREQ